ncbi:MAG UNVERIFIED_CONTAM: hypothetical protein LVQ98_02655 [Rickettsiaceae bacterium]
MDNIEKVWVNGILHDISQYNYRFYSGTKTQMPDPYIEKIEGKSPAFRDLAYIVFENFPLHNFSNKIPHFSFEVTRYIKDEKSLEHKIENLCIIPGSGEFVYDTQLQEKITFSQIGDVELCREYINKHNPQKYTRCII